MERKKLGPTVFRGESAAIFSFGKNRDFERLIPYTRSPISVPHFRRYLQPDSTQATQNFSIGVIFDAESDGIEIFWKLKNFTISRNKVRVQPIVPPMKNVYGTGTDRLSNGLEVGQNEGK